MGLVVRKLVVFQMPPLAAGNVDRVARGVGRVDRMIADLTGGAGDRSRSDSRPGLDSKGIGLAQSVKIRKLALTSSLPGSAQARGRQRLLEGQRPAIETCRHLLPVVELVMTSVQVPAAFKPANAASGICGLNVAKNGADSVLDRGVGDCRRRPCW